LSELLEAVYRGDHAHVGELLASDPQLDIFEAAAVGRTERVAELLDADSGLVSAWAEDGFTPLHLAAFFRHPDTARILVDRGALVDVVARNERIRVTPLQSAVAARQERRQRCSWTAAPTRTRRRKVDSPRCTPPRSKATSRWSSCSSRTGPIRRWRRTTAERRPTLRATRVTRVSPGVSRPASLSRSRCP
jgi:Ankyrin repeats (3 copies)